MIWSGGLLAREQPPEAGVQASPASSFLHTLKLPLLQTIHLASLYVGRVSLLATMFSFEGAVNKIISGSI